MKKRGFTLVELMGVLIIIGMLMLILIPVISNVIKKQKEDQYVQQTNTIKLASKNFGSDNLVMLPNVDGEYIYITLGQLKAMGYMDKSIINPLTDEEFSDCVRVKITKSGNNYIYEYEQESEKTTECSTNGGSIIITGPIKEYINKENTTSYIITINNDKDDNVFVEYEIKKDKITLTGDKDATYSVVEGNGIFRIIIQAGDLEGEIGLKLESGAILKNESEDLIGEDGLEADERIIVDNTAPEIVFGTNGNSEWAKEATSTITVTDSGSGGDEASYKYVYTDDILQKPINTFINGNEYNENKGTGNYYLVASACDTAGNCTTQKSNVFKLDNEGPSKPSIGLRNDRNEYLSMDGSWINYTVYVAGGTIDNEPLGMDNGSGIKNYQISTDQDTWYEWEYDPESYLYKITNGAVKRYVRAIDNVGNVGEIEEITINIDRQSPIITSVSIGKCTGDNKRSITVKADDILSGVNYYNVSTGQHQSSGGTYTSENIWTSGLLSPREEPYYVYVNDKSGNVSDYVEVSISACGDVPIITCNPNNAYAEIVKDGTMTSSPLTINRTTECAAYVTLPYISGEIFTFPDDKLFTVTGSAIGAYDISIRKTCNDTGMCRVCDSNGICNCTQNAETITCPTQMSFRATEGNCINNYCTTEYTMKAKNIYGTVTRTFTYYFKY